MIIPGRYLWVLSLFLFSLLSCSWAEKNPSGPQNDGPASQGVKRIGQIEDRRLVECSGMEPSLAAGDLFWAINDGGNEPFLYALGGDGRSRGRVRVAGAENRDWEGMDMFRSADRPMILIADFGDNDRRYDTHTLYIVEEPRLSGKHFREPTEIPVARRILFSYPDGRHDAEAVAVDPVGQTILILTKRDNPPLLYEVPLFPPPGDRPVTAQKIGTVSRIPPPSDGDLMQKYGFFRSQPTSLDLSPDNRYAVVLTYKHAYLFERRHHESWAASLGGNPVTIPLPLPQDRSDLRQREAVCFAADSRALYVTSEGKNAGIFRREVR